MGDVTGLVILLVLTRGGFAVLCTVLVRAKLRGKGEERAGQETPGGV